MAGPLIWHGTPAESSEVMTAIAHNCACEFGVMGVRTATCVPHAEFVKDQRWLDGMVFARRMRSRLLQEEFTCLGH